jgi:hypothetical protein
MNTVHVTAVPNKSLGVVKFGVSFLEPETHLHEFTPDEQESFTVASFAGDDAFVAAKQLALRLETLLSKALESPDYRKSFSIYPYLFVFLVEFFGWA